MLTTSTRIKNQESCALLGQHAAVWSQSERAVFWALYGNKSPATKRGLCEDLGLSSRQFNSINIGLKGMLVSYLANQKNHISETREKIGDLEKKIKENHLLIDGKRIVKETIRFEFHQWQRRLGRLKSDLKRMESANNTHRFSICFGGKKLFKAQHFLKENGFKDHASWRRNWQDSRSGKFFCVGSKDEMRGNSECQLIVENTSDTGPIRGHIKLKTMAQSGCETSHILIPAEWNYNPELLRHALKTKQAISYRFVRDHRGRWHAHATTEQPIIPLKTLRHRGCLGVDYNPGILAGYVISGDGNPIEDLSVSIATLGKSTSQNKWTLGNAVQVFVGKAIELGVPISIEDLDFSGLKKKLRSAGYSRQVSAMTYGKFRAIMASACAKAGVELIVVDPAFTSVIGCYKYANGYGLSRHSSAAIIIARRALKFSERIERRQTAPELPVDDSRPSKLSWKAVQTGFRLGASGWRWSKIKRRAKTNQPSRRKTFKKRRRFDPNLMIVNHRKRISWELVNGTLAKSSPAVREGMKAAPKRSEVLMTSGF